LSIPAAALYVSSTPTPTYLQAPRLPLVKSRLLFEHTSSSIIRFNNTDTNISSSIETIRRSERDRRDYPLVKSRLYVEQNSSIYTLHYRHQHHLALEPESQLPSGRPRRSLDTGVAPANLFHIGEHQRRPTKASEHNHYQPVNLRLYFGHTFKRRDCRLSRVAVRCGAVRCSAVRCCARQGKARHIIAHTDASHPSAHMTVGVC
jgi:hypothetical protein